MFSSETNGTPAFKDALLQAISKNAIDFIGVIDKQDMKILFINEPGAKLFGFGNPKEALGISITKLQKPRSEQQGLDYIYKSIEIYGCFTDEIECVTQAGIPFWAKRDLSAFSTDGAEYLLVQIEKIDRAKTAEDKLLAEQQRFGALLEHASMGVLIADHRQNIYLMNPFGLRLFGYTMKEMKGKPINQLIPDRYHAKHHGHYEQFQALPQNRPMGLGMDLYGIKKDGSEFPLEISLGAYKMDDETFAIAFINDITVRKKGEDDIIELNRQLEGKVKERTEQLATTISKLEKQINETDIVEAELRKSLAKEKDLNELKSRFVSMASHEFRTPLSTVLSSTYLLQQYTGAGDQPKRLKHLQRIVSSVNMLTDILNDFLSVGKIEEGKTTIKPSFFGLEEYIYEIIEQLKPIAKPGQQILYIHHGEPMVWMDMTLLKHIVMNLLSNAIKFSPEHSSIQIETKRLGQELLLSVQDQGIGIPANDQPHLFERFFRGGNVSAIQGTGLGLHIIKRYTELMGGHIECRSDIEKGTLFSLRFELSPPL